MEHDGVPEGYNYNPHHDRATLRYWSTLPDNMIPQPVRDIEYAGRVATSALGVQFEGIELTTDNGTYRVLADGVVQRTRILPLCGLPVTDAWSAELTDEPHDGAPCVPPGP